MVPMELKRADPIIAKCEHGVPLAPKDAAATSSDCLMCNPYASCGWLPISEYGRPAPVKPRHCLMWQCPNFKGDYCEGCTFV